MGDVGQHHVHVQRDTIHESIPVIRVNILGKDDRRAPKIPYFQPSVAHRKRVTTQWNQETQEAGKTAYQASEADRHRSNTIGAFEVPVSVAMPKPHQG